MLCIHSHLMKPTSLFSTIFRKGVGLSAVLGINRIGLNNHKMYGKLAI